MSYHHKEFAEDTYFVCHTPQTGVVHFGLASAPATLTSGQESCDYFSTEAELAARVDEIKDIPGWYEDNKIVEPDPSLVSNVT